MPEPQAYLNGTWITASQAAIPLFDAGFVLGATVSEQLRTFHGKLFRLEEHLRRLARGLQIVGIELEQGPAELGEIAARVAESNYPLLSAGGDLGLAILVTPGPYGTFGDAARPGPTVCVHTYPLPFRRWADRYTSGQALALTGTEMVSPRSWPPELKCRSRMHYYLADLEAQRQSPGARALLLDAQGLVRETATGNVLLCEQAGGKPRLVSPPRETILPGISLGVVEELASSLYIDFVEGDFTPQELACADEVLLTSTPWCVLPVTQLAGLPIGTGQPGPVFQQILAAWSQEVGLDIAAQAVNSP